MKITSLSARRILDSRGEWTVEAALESDGGARVLASVPQGKSVGSHEERSLKAAEAARNVNGIIAREILSREFPGQASFDARLNALDGTARKSRLGANALLATSISFLRLTALTKKTPLWLHIRAEYETSVKPFSKPQLFMNMINGGLHSGNNLRFQEYLVISKSATIKQAAEAGIAIYRELGETLERVKGKSAINVGDEGGYAPDFKDDAEPFQMLRAAALKSGFLESVGFGMDAAAADIKEADPAELRGTYEKLIEDYGLAYLEDPFSEEDFSNFAALTALCGGKMLICGDDLTATNISRMEKARAAKSVNAVIIKPNQIGTVTESLNAARKAREYGWAVIASHRSGETDDDFIADFAYGIGADGLKLGAPARGERVAKYNRILAIETEDV